MSSVSNGLYEFGAYCLDVDQRLLTRQNQRVPLPPKAFDLLLLLVQSPGRALSKQELMSSLWPETFVEEANLSFQISTLRKALGDDDAEWIETVPKHGYRFAAAVVIRPPAASVANAEPAPAPPVSPASPGPASTSRRWSAAAMLAVLVLGLAGARYSGRLGPESSGPVDRFSSVPMPLTTYPGIETAPTLSPDGNHVAFVWNGPRQDNYDIYVKLVGDGEPWQLTNGPENDDSPAWSPNGAQIAYMKVRGSSEGEVWLTPATPGAVQRLIAPFLILRFGRWRDIDWSRDGKWLAVGGRPSPTDESGIWLLEVDGNRRRRLTAPVAQGWQRDVNPVFSPDGRHLAFVRLKAASDALFVQRMSAALEPIGEPIQVQHDPRRRISSVAWPDNDTLVVALGGHIARNRLEQIALSLNSTAPAAARVLLPFGEGAEAITMSRTGRLAYSKELRDANLWKLDLTRPNSVLEDSGLVSSTYDEGTPDYSPLDDRVVFSSTRSGSEELYISKIDGSGLQRMTNCGGAQCSNPQWSPDGKWILYNSSREGSTDLYLLTPATGQSRPITHDPTEELEARWSRDGESIYFASNRLGRSDIWKMPREGGDARRITQHGAASAQESIDGQLLYYAKGTPTGMEIWRVPIAAGEEQRVVGGLSNQLNYVVVKDGIYFIAVGKSRSETSVEFFDFATGQRKILTKIGKPWWFGLALSPDGRWLLFPTVDQEGRDLMVVDGVR